MLQQIVLETKMTVNVHTFDTGMQHWASMKTQTICVFISRD